MIITLLGVCRFVPGLMTLALFQGHRCVSKMNCKKCFVASCPVQFTVASYFENIMYNMLSGTGVYLKEIINTFFPVYL